MLNASARNVTQNSQEYVIDINGLPFRFVDAEWARIQRKKWFHTFENMTALLFLVSSSAFDEVIPKDGLTNKWVEGVRMFDTIVRSRIISTKLIIVLFTKVDLLREKIKLTNIKDYFIDFPVRSYKNTA